jgi:hypothetical protein
LLNAATADPFRSQTKLAEPAQGKNKTTPILVLKCLAARNQQLQFKLPHLTYQRPLDNNQALIYLNQKQEIYLREKETRPLVDHHLNKFNINSKKKEKEIPTAATPCKFCRGCGYRHTM